MKFTFAFLALLFCSIVNGQALTKRALFLGNSYTNANNLPQMVADLASSTGDTLFFDSNTPGGYTLQGHSTNPESLAKIASGNWDYVVLQEQSQLPSFSISQVETDVFPYACILDSIINDENPCAETVFYMTWGRKNGDASNCSWWPPVCTYEGMDSLVNWLIGEYDPEADFSYFVSEVYLVSFTNISRYATNYYWNFGDGDTSSSINPTNVYPASGEYVVTLIAENCGLSDTTYQTIDITSVGLNESIESDQPIIYPNPVSTSFTLNLKMTGSLTYRIVNLTGLKIQEGVISPSENQVNVSSLSNGMYFLQLSENEKLIRQEKFVIESE